MNSLSWDMSNDPCQNHQQSSTNCKLYINIYKSYVVDNLRKMIENVLQLERECCAKEIAEKKEIKEEIKENIKELKSSLRNYEIIKQKCIYENTNLKRMIKLLSESNDRYIQRKEEIEQLINDIKVLSEGIKLVWEETSYIKKCIEDEKENIENIKKSIRKMNKNISQVNVSYIIFIIYTHILQKEKESFPSCTALFQKHNKTIKSKIQAQMHFNSNFMLNMVDVVQGKYSNRSKSASSV